MKLNRNKKILLTLGCILIVFGLYKYFGNVVEGFKMNKNYEFGMDRVSANLIKITNVDETINDMINPQNVKDMIEKINIAINDVKVAHDTMVPIKEGLKIKKKKHPNAPVQPAAVQAAAPVQPAAVQVIELTLDQQTAIDKVLTTATDSLNAAIVSRTTVYKENPIINTTTNTLTAAQNIIYGSSLILAGLDQSLKMGLKQDYINAKKTLP